MIFDFWKKAASVDIGENLSVPINKSNGEWWHFVIAGGVAGGVSRTATAPLDRIKTVLQLSKVFLFYIKLFILLFNFLNFGVSEWRK